MTLNKAHQITCESATLTRQELAVVRWYLQNYADTDQNGLGSNGSKMLATLNKLALPSPYGDPR